MLLYQSFISTVQLFDIFVSSNLINLFLIIYFKNEICMTLLQCVSSTTLLIFRLNISQLSCRFTTENDLYVSFWLTSKVTLLVRKELSMCTVRKQTASCCSTSRVTLKYLFSQCRYIFVFGSYCSVVKVIRSSQLRSGLYGLMGCNCSKWDMTC